MSDKKPGQSVPQPKPQQPQKPATERFDESLKDSFQYRDCSFTVTQANREVKKPTKGNNGSGN